MYGNIIFQFNMIDPVTTQKIHDAAKVVEVVEDFITLKKRGANFLGLCPFHNEKTPSFTVSPAKGIFKCFGCGESGNSVGFVMKHEKISYPEALKYIAKKYNIEVVEKERTPEEIIQQKERESLFIVSEYAKNFFQKSLHNTDEGKTIALSYFRERGFRDDIIKKFELGWSPKKRDAISEAGVKAGYKSQFFEKVGLVIYKQETNYRFDRFAGRVMFPIHSLAGKVIGFGGRTLVTDKKIAKYLNSPESEIYHKSNILYGIYQAKSDIVKKDKCIMVEGYTDVISMHQNGVENVVASSGTSLTQNQIQLVKRFTKNLTIIYDGDSAGIKASLRGIDLVLAEEMIVRVVPLPDGEDPDSFSRKLGSSELEKYISEHEIDFIKFKTDLLLEDVAGDPVKRAQLVTNIVGSISVIPSTILRAEYIKETSKILDVKEETLYSEIRKILSNRVVYKNKQQEHNKHKVNTPPVPDVSSNIFSEPYERLVLYFLLNHGEKDLFHDDETGINQTVAQYIISELKNDNLEFKNLLYSKIFSEYDYCIENQLETPDINYFLNHKNPQISSLTANIVAPDTELSKIWKKRGATVEMPDDRLHESVPEVVVRFKFKILELMIEEVDKEIMNLKPENYDSLKELLDKKMMLDNHKILMTKEVGERVMI